MAAIPLPLLPPRISTIFPSILRSSFLLKTVLRTSRDTAPCKRSSLVPLRASEKGIGDADNENAALISQEDLKYLGGLGAVSVSGAAAIEYGSGIFPQITQPNIAQALLMIFVPVIVLNLVDPAQQGLGPWVRVRIWANLQLNVGYFYKTLVPR